MKKYVVISLLLDIAIVIVAVSMFACNSNELQEQQIVDVSKIIIQATVTGAITFTGLLLTFLSQELQTKSKNQLDMCPCFFVERHNSLSALMEQKNLPQNANAIICSSAARIRTVECEFANCKNNFGLNVVLKTSEGEHKLGNIKTQSLKLTLALNGEAEEELCLNFEDVYGIKYNQSIKYTYQNRDIVFTSNQPKRRK